MKKIIFLSLFTCTLFSFFACKKTNTQESFRLDYVVKNTSSKAISFIHLRGFTTKDTTTVEPGATANYQGLITSDGTPTDFFEKINVKSSIFVLTQGEKITTKNVDNIKNWTLLETSATPKLKVDAIFEVTDSDF
ncbi:MAG: hypothetical protein RLZZ292_2839 [Bacteroidota bacterium]|jgi:hypothetical protein